MPTNALCRRATHAAYCTRTRAALWVLPNQHTRCAPGHMRRSWGIRGAIALTVAGVNLLLKGLLSWLVVLERRWTRTSLERSYALLCYLAMLVNSVIVVLLVRLCACLCVCVCVYARVHTCVLVVHDRLLFQLCMEGWGVEACTHRHVPAEKYRACACTPTAFECATQTPFCRSLVSGLHAAGKLQLPGPPGTPPWGGLGAVLCPVRIL
jgi:hypothetical protein